MDVKQEIRDLFARNSGQYEPTPQEVDAINAGLDQLFDSYERINYQTVAKELQRMKALNRHSNAQLVPMTGWPLFQVEDFMLVK